VHVVDTLILPLLFSVFLIALGYLGWRDIQSERRRRQKDDETKVETTQAAASKDSNGDPPGSG